MTLKVAEEISIPGAPAKDSVFIASTNIETWECGLANVKMVDRGSEGLSYTSTLVLMVVISTQHRSRYRQRAQSSNGTGADPIRF